MSRAKESRELHAPGSPSGPQGDVGDYAHHARRWADGFSRQMEEDARRAEKRGDAHEAVRLRALGRTSLAHAVAAEAAGGRP